MHYDDEDDDPIKRWYKQTRTSNTRKQRKAKSAEPLSMAEVLTTFAIVIVVLLHAIPLVQWAVSEPEEEPEFNIEDRVLYSKAKEAVKEEIWKEKKAIGYEKNAGGYEITNKFIFYNNGLNHHQFLNDEALYVVTGTIYKDLSVGHDLRDYDVEFDANGKVLSVTFSEK